ncbi:MAG TPA: FAD-dependent thymidylate synthase [Myxococcales bacterium]|nr:FAD-dependent thymidylate synthase [Myxococcales bacterium]
MSLAAPFRTPTAPFRSLPPKATLTNGFTDAFDNSVATARTCYSSRIVSTEDVRKDEKARALRDRIAKETYAAGHHTTIQHATFQFAVERVSRQGIWSFLHAHPFYNSEQVSQRYVEVKPGNVIRPELPLRLGILYDAAVEDMMGAYQSLIDLLQPRVAEEFFRIFPARRRAPEKWALAIKKRAQEVARYVLPIGTFAHLYHTVSGLTLHRYHRLCQQLDAPTEMLLLVKAMVAEVKALDPLFFERVEDPLPLEQTLEHRALLELGRLRASSSGAKEFNHAFDADLGPLRSRLVDWTANGERSVARGVRAVLGVTEDALPDPAAIDLVLSPRRNPYLAESLVLTTVSKVTRALSHSHYTFQKKLSHAADSQDQRHRMAPASRPVLHAQFVPGEVDAIVPDLVEAVPAAEDRFQETLQRTWRTIEQLLHAGIPEEMALYLLPNAFPVRFHESGDLLHLHHKWVHRLCYTAQEEIWRCSLEEVQQVRRVHPRLGQHLVPPCTLRKEAGITPFCPEGPRFCGLPVWNIPLEGFQRLI